MRCLAFSLAAVVVCVVPGLAWGEPVPGIRLLKDARGFDGKTVQYQGEVIGDVMKRGDFAWVNVKDGDGVIPVWVPVALTDGIRFRGDYRNRGDTVLVEGTFHRFCTAHGGGVDLHAREMRVIKPGVPMEYPLRRNELYAAVFLVLIGLVLGAVYKFISRGP